MISFHLIKTIARYEMRTLMRSWFFRIFAGLAIVGLSIFNIAVNIEDNGAPWLYRALGASMPYVNLLVLNVAQAIVAVFLASEFLKQDRKNDTVEVIYARSMTNTEYILGKTFGILSVFFFLNLVILILGYAFSFISPDSAKGSIELLIYPLLISLPTLVFILGLSFYFMVLLKNQAVTFILLLGYIAVSVFYLNTKFYHLFDYIAYHVPMLSSSIGGFGNLYETILHRGIYLLIGIGFVFLTINRMSRLPQAKRLVSLPLYLGIVFILGGTYMGKMYVDSKLAVIETKKAIISLNNSYQHLPKLHIDENIMELLHEGEQIKVKADLSLSNKSFESVDTLVLSLNPALNVSKLKINKKDVSFERKSHLVVAALPFTLGEEEKIDLHLEYAGGIDENVCFLDADLEEYSDNEGFEIFRIRKRYAYLTKQYVCLTNEALWYPISGVTYSDNNPLGYLPDFTNFNLTVATDTNLTSISQGVIVANEPGYTSYKNNKAIPRLSLLIGDYRTHQMEVDSVNFELYTIAGNEYYKEHFTELGDSINDLISELKTEYESSIEMKYPFERFILAEVPIHFALNKHIWSLASDAIQPQMVLYPEMGLVMDETDFRRRKKRTEERMKRKSEEILPEELETRIFKRFIRSNFIASTGEWYQYDVMDKNTYSIFPNYYTFVTQLNSSEWPVVNMALETFLKERSVNEVKSERWFWRGLSKEERMNLEFKRSSLKEIIKNGVEKPEESYEEELMLNEVVYSKGTQLFKIISASVGEESFTKFIQKVLNKNKHQAISFTLFDNLFKEEYGESLETRLTNWYEEKKLPGYLVKDLQTYQIKVGEYTKYQVRLKISNPQEVDGLVTINVEMNDKNREQRQWWDNSGESDASRQVFIPAGTAKEIGFVFPSEPARMNINTHISENLPNNLIYDFKDFEKVRRVPEFDGVENTEMFNTTLLSGEVVVDNEDKGFSFHQNVQESYLKTLIHKNKKRENEYTGVRFWNPPSKWTPILRTNFYGKFVRSARYTKSGDGSRTVQWVPELQKKAFYDVYCNLELLDYGKNRKCGDMHFKVYNDDGVEEIKLGEQELETGWNYLGSYYISPENAKVELNNESNTNMVIADAIKWVKTQ